MVPKAMINHLMLLVGFLVVMNIQVHCEGSNDDVINPTFLENAVSKGAVCLDGSPAAYYYAKGFGVGSNNWMVYLEGGGWCYNVTDCLKRTKEQHGSSKDYSTVVFGGILSQNSTLNPDFYDWNRVKVRYCDGSSFTGDVEAVENNFYRRGARIFKAVVEDLLAKGMQNSSNVMLVGNSAGGLATMLNCDRFRAFLPTKSRVKCVSDSGFFFRGDFYETQKRYDYFGDVTNLHNMTPRLPASCTSKMDDPIMCIFPENIVGDIQTPLFILNSALDWLQLQYWTYPKPENADNWKMCTAHPDTCTEGQNKTMSEFQQAMWHTLEGIVENPSRGVFINSYFTHDFIYKNDCWNGKGSPTLGNKTIAEAIGDWYYDRSSFYQIDKINVTPLNATHS